MSANPSANLVLTVIADDKPGIVEILSATIADNGGNWLESRMAQLAGKFAGILRISVPSEQANGLMEALLKLDTQGILVRIEATTDPAAGNGQQLNIHVVGDDRAGIVKEISRVLAGLGVNVLELTTRCTAAEMSAVPLFRSDLLVSMPASLSTDDVSDALEALSDDLMVEIS